MAKKGMSDVVSTVLIILIVVVAVAVIGTIVLRMSSNTREQIEVASSPINVEIVGGSVQVNPILSKVLLNVKRSPASGNINGINFVLSDDTGNTQVIRKDFLPGDFNALEAKSVELAYDTAVLTGNIKSISAAPIIVGSSGKEFVGNRPSLKTLSGSEKMAFMAAYWKFDSEADKGVDFSGNGNNGASGAMPSINLVPADQIPGAPSGTGVASFSGTQYIQVPNSDSLNFGTGSFSIVFWANNPAVAGAGEKIVDKIVPGVGYSIRFVDQSGPDYLNPLISSSTTVYTNPNVGAYANSWRCHVVVFDRDSAQKQIKTYISMDSIGSLPAAPSSTNIVTGLGSTTNDQVLTIGKNSAGIEAYSGLLDDLMIFNKALSSAEAQKVCDYAKTH